MARKNEKQWRELREQVIGESDPKKMLDMLLALDQMVVELSMRIYNISQGDRFIMRKQNRRLHNMVREHFPRVLEERAG